jgi:hypothetical protein
MIFAVVANPSTAAIFGLFLTKFLFHFEINTIPNTQCKKITSFLTQLFSKDNYKIYI